MKTLLAAAEQEGETRLPKPGVSGVDTAVSLGALELALADMAIDLSALDTSEPERRGLEALSLRRPRHLRPPAVGHDRRPGGGPHRQRFIVTTSASMTRPMPILRNSSRFWRGPARAMAAGC